MTKQMKKHFYSSSTIDMLPLWLEKGGGGDVPQATYKRYWNSYTRLRNDIMPVWESIAAIAASGGTFLTDHGEKHADTVIQRASCLLKELQFDISTYEAYILLCAMLIHDTGNIFGRENHERNVITALHDIPFFSNSTTHDDVEIRIIKCIAEAHSGEIYGTRDTISKIEEETYSNHEPIRMQALAAILRLSDELADEKNRANRFLMQENLISNASQRHHEYSLALNSVIIKSNSIMLKFNIPKSKLHKKFALQEKGRTKIFLIDEIYNRCVKLHFERIYCMRFLYKHSLRSIDSIAVSIKMYNDIKMHTIISDDEIKFSLKENGHPIDKTKKDIIYDLCPTLKKGVDDGFGLAKKFGGKKQ